MISLQGFISGRFLGSGGEECSRAPFLRRKIVELLYIK
jgi:hypothetical protein